MSHRFRASGLLAGVAIVLLAACAKAPAPQATTAATAPTGTDRPVASGVAADLQAMLPTVLNGFEAHQFAVGQDMLLRLAEALRVPPTAIEAAFASDHGERFVQTYAIRAAGRSSDQLGEAFVVAAYAPEDGGTTSASEESVGGRNVQVVDNPAASERIGTYYALTTGDVLIVVQSFDRDVAAAAIEALPAPVGG